MSPPSQSTIQGHASNRNEGRDGDDDEAGVEQHCRSHDSGGSSSSSSTLTPEASRDKDRHGDVKLVLVMISIILGNFLGGLDLTVLATAIPVITTYFKSLDDVGWYGAVYYMSFCINQPLSGKLLTLYPKKIVYLSYLAVFEIGSLVCALAPTSHALIVGRALAGLGASGMLGGGFIILTVLSPVHKRPLVTGISKAAFGAAQILGPLIGGAFAERVTWRWCFYLNLPVGGVVAILVILVLHLPKAETEKLDLMSKLKTIDFLGFLLLGGAVVMLLLALEMGGTEHAWNSSVIIGLFVGCGVTFIVFVAWQMYMRESALVPPGIFNQRTTILAFGCSFLANGGFQCVVYYLPIWFQAVLGASPISSGVRYLPTVISDVLTAIIGGTIVMLIGVYKPFLMLGCALLSIGGGLLTTLWPDISEGRWIGYQIVVGCSTSLIGTMPLLALQTVLPPNLIPIASSLLVGTMSASCAILLSIAKAIFTDRLKHNLIGITTEEEASRIVSEGASRVQEVIRQDRLNVTAVTGAYSRAVTDVFYIPAVCAAIAFCLVSGMKWTNLKKVKSQSSAKPQEKRNSEEPPIADVEGESPEVVSKRRSMLAKLRQSRKSGG